MSAEDWLARRIRRFLGLSLLMLAGAVLALDRTAAALKAHAAARSAAKPSPARLAGAGR